MGIGEWAVRRRSRRGEHLRGDERHQRGARAEPGGEGPEVERARAARKAGQREEVEGEVDPRRRRVEGLVDGRGHGALPGLGEVGRADHEGHRQGTAGVVVARHPRGTIERAHPGRGDPAARVEHARGALAAQDDAAQVEAEPEGLGERGRGRRRSVARKAPVAGHGPHGATRWRELRRGGLDANSHGVGRVPERDQRERPGAAIERAEARNGVEREGIGHGPLGRRLVGGQARAPPGP